MLDIGTVISGYRVEGVLGQGGMGTVYEALQLSLNRPVALKVLSPQLSADPAFRERFRREGLMQASMDHPHILPVYEAGDAGGALFLAMRLVRGPTLKDMILSRLLDPERTLRILHPVAEALDTAHEFGLIHRDVTPQNVLVGARDHAYLSDFGLTKVVGQRGVTQQNQFVGTVDYVSPEQVRRRPATTRSDVYALGAVIHECLTGAVPFPRESDPEVLFAHLSEAPPRPSERRPELPEELDAVIARAMAKEPEGRFATGGELMREVEAALRQSGAAGLGPPPPVRGDEEAGLRRRTSDISDELDLPVTMPPDGGGVVAPAAARARARSRALTEALPSAAATAATAEQRPPVSRRRRTAFAAAAVAAAAGAAGALAGAASGGGDGSSATRWVTAPDRVVTLAIPSSWRVLDRPSRMGVLPPKDSIAAVPPDGPAGAGIVAGDMHTFGPSLLPRRFIDRIGGVPARSDRVRLGEVGAYRYRDQTPRGAGRRVTLFAAPTTAGSVAIACYVADSVPFTAGSAYLDRCGRIAGSLRLVGARPFGLEPSRVYARELSRVMRAVNPQRVAGRADLRAAASNAERAEITHKLDRNMRLAAQTLDRMFVSPSVKPAHARVTAGLEDMARGYATMSEAAEAGDMTRYDAGAREVSRNDGRVQQAIALLKVLGYRIT